MRKSSPTKDLGTLALTEHRKLAGKISVVSKRVIRSIRDLNMYYTPGVGAVSAYVAAHKREVRNLTIKNNTVAIISDGSAVLGLGNIGPAAAIPVMEGKAMIFKDFGGIDAFPIVLGTQDVDTIVETVALISPVFGGINLEDISAPRCFEIEKRLKKILDIPVMHDDQHGTAIVVLAGLINAFTVVGKKIRKGNITILGAGAAGTAITHLLISYGIRNIVVVDRNGILNTNRKDLNKSKKELARITNRNNIEGGIGEAVHRADAVIGVSGPHILKKEHIHTMADKPIVFALANPIPEISPLAAEKAGAFIVATGRSDFKNQINNALVFPGEFRGALDNKISTIKEKMKIHAALNLARLIKNPKRSKIIPSLFDKRVVASVAKAIRSRPR